MALPNLPFPIAELGWDKFEQVRESAGLSHDECMTVMRLACGDPPEDFDTHHC